MKMKISICTIFLLVLGSTQLALAQGRLFMGSDNGQFTGGPSKLAWVDTLGPATVGPVTVITLGYPLNGLTGAPGFLLAGQAEPELVSPGNTLREIDYDGNIIVTIAPGVPAFPASCCNEQMVEYPAGVLYHAHHPDVIQRLRITGGGGPKSVVVGSSFPQAEVVGMTLVDFDPNTLASNTIWISKWNPQMVGTWNPGTNTFVPVFSTAPFNAAALAWDGANGVLWVGLQGGMVVPYDTTGVQLGPGFSPLGAIGNQVDGMAFVPAPVP